VLFRGKGTDAAAERLDALVRTTDGFRIAEEDLRIRGPGEFLGVRQHGLPELRIANLVSDAAILAEAREDAFELVRRDPGLTGESEAVRRALERRFGRRATITSEATS